MITPDSEKARLQMDNARNVLKRYHNKLRFFQVINEDWHTHIARAKVYTDQTAWFAALRHEFPDVELGVCDCWSYDPKNRLPDVGDLKKRYPGINFISMHAHNPRQLWASPREMYETYDPYLDTGIKIHVTEFGIIMGELSGGYRSGKWDEQKLAEYFVQALATAYSHPAVEAFNLWSSIHQQSDPKLVEATTEVACCSRVGNTFRAQRIEKHFVIATLPSILQSNATTQCVVCQVQDVVRFMVRLMDLQQVKAAIHGVHKPDPKQHLVYQINSTAVDRPEFVCQLEPDALVCEHRASEIIAISVQTPG